MPTVDPNAKSAAEGGLTYVCDTDAGIRRTDQHIGIGEGAGHTIDVGIRHADRHDTRAAIVGQDEVGKDVGRMPAARLS